MRLLRPVDELLGAYRRARASNPETSNLPAGEPPESQDPLRAAEAGDAYAVFRTLSEHVPAAVLYVDAQGICRAHNRALEGLLGLCAADIDGHPLRELTGATSYLCIEESVQQALGGEEVWLRQVHPRPDGTLIAFDGHYVAHRDADGQVHGFVALLTPNDAAPETGAPADPQSAHAADAGVGGEQQADTEAADAVASDGAARRRIALAIQARRFSLYRQEIVSLTDSEPGVCAWEILLRVKDGTQRLIHPAAFLGIAQSAGAVAELDRWVVDRLVQVLSAGGDDGTCAFHVNLCHESVLNTGLAHRLRQVLERRAMAASRMHFEINESELVRNRMNVMACAHALRMLGCRVGLDRFTGDTGMVAALFDLPIDFVKIDGSIVSALQTSTRARTRVQVIAKLAGGNRVRTIAEHVEAPETLDIVRSLGVDAVQGYGVAMPEPFE